VDIYIDMTKTQLKQLIKECLNEIDFAPGFRPQTELTIIAFVIGSQVDDLKRYLLKMARVLHDEFGNDIEFDENLNSLILPNKDKKTEATFTLKNQDDLDSTKEILSQIQEELTMWSIKEDLVIDFGFKIKN
jgi:hypothetical protein